jgi:hypothetical protein
MRQNSSDSDMGLYDSQWQRYRRLRLLSLLSLLPFCPFILGVYLHGTLESPIPLPILMFFGMVGVGAWFVLNFFRCPRCNKLFAMTWWFNLSVFAQKSSHCGLKKFSNGDEE